MPPFETISSLATQVEIAEIDGGRPGRPLVGDTIMSNAIMSNAERQQRWRDRRKEKEEPQPEGT